MSNSSNIQPVGIVKPIGKGAQRRALIGKVKPFKGITKKLFSCDSKKHEIVRKKKNDYYAKSKQ